LNAEQFKIFLSQLYQSFSFECLIHAHFTVEEALALADTITRTIPAKPLSASEILYQRVVKLPKGITSVFQMSVLNSEDENSAIENYYQVGMENPQNNALLNLFISIAHDPLFLQLRTREQLGYSVWGVERQEHGIHGYRVVVHSPSKDPIFLDQRIEDFFLNFKDHLEAITELEWDTFVKSQISKRLELNKTLTQESNRYWKEIVDHSYRYDLELKEVEVLKSVIKRDLIDFFDRYISPNSPDRRKLSIQVFGKSRPIPTEEGEAHIFYIKSIPNFKNSLPYWPMSFIRESSGIAKL